MRDIKREIEFFLENLNGGKVFQESKYFVSSEAFHFFQKLSHMPLGTSKDIYLLKNIMTIVKE